MKRALSMIVCLVMLLTMLPMNTFADTVSDEQTVAAEGISIGGTGSFGNLLSDELEDFQGGSGSDEDNFAAGYSVVALSVENNIATVEYSSMEDANLMVCIYTEDGLQLLASGSAVVNADESFAEVALEGEMPQYFLASAYLVDSYDYSPLCAPYDTPMYTMEMQQLLASTVEDYDADKVVQLSDSTETNFAVYNDDVVVIDGGEGVNTVISTDFETDTYIIENADEQLTSLTAGTIFAYPWAEGELLIVKVSTVTVDGTTATITGAEMELEEVFDYLKLETQAGMDGAQLDTGDMDEGLTYEGMWEDGPSTYAWEGGAEISKSLFFGLEKEFENPDKTAKVTVSGGLTLSVKGSLSFYISMKSQFLELKMTPQVGAACTVSGALNAQELALGKVKLPTGVPGVFLEGTPKLVLQFSAEVEFAATISMQMGIGYESGRGFQNLCTKPVAETDVSVAGKVYVGLILKCSAAIIDENIASIGISNKLGLQLTGTPQGTDFEGQPAADAARIHSCAQCLDLRYDFVYSLSGEMIFLKYIKVEKVYKTVTVHLFNSYFTMDGTGAGFGRCPNILYRTVLKVNDGDTIVSGAQITANGTDLGVTGQNGTLVYYLPEGKHTVIATKDGKTAQQTFAVKEAGSVTLDLATKENSGISGILGAVNGNIFSTSRFDVGFKESQNNFLVSGTTLQFDNETTIDKANTIYMEGRTDYGFASSQDVKRVDRTKPLFMEQTFLIEALPVKKVAGHAVFEANSPQAKGLAFAFSVYPAPNALHNYNNIFLASIQNDGNGALTLYIADRVTYNYTSQRIIPLGVSLGEEFTLGVLWNPDDTMKIYLNGTCIDSFNGDMRKLYRWSSVGAYYYVGYSNLMGDAKFTVSDINVYGHVPSGYTDGVMTLSLTKPEQVEQTSNNLSRGVFDGEYTNSAALRTASFAGLVPGQEYLLLALADVSREDPLEASNLLFADQATAQEDGTLVFQYVQRQETDVAYVMACGPSNQNLADAQITLPAVWEDPQGQSQLITPVVEYNGSVLEEGKDYVLVGQVDYTISGKHTCYIRGIHDYAGLVTCTYEVQPWSWTLHGDVTMKHVSVPADVTLDLNGHKLMINSLASFGDIVDTVGTGCLVAEDLVLTENSYLPLFDSEEGGYRFFAYSQKNLGTKTAGENVIFGFALEFENKDAYRLLSDREDYGLDVTMTLGWNDIRMPFAFGSELLIRYAQLQVKYPGLTAALQLTVSGLETLEPGTVLAVTPAVVAVDGQMTEENEAMTYIP